jgi:hypothetical protein
MAKERVKPGVQESWFNSWMNPDGSHQPQVILLFKMYRLYSPLRGGEGLRRKVLSTENFNLSPPCLSNAQL